MDSLVYIVPVLAALLTFSAFFSASETSLFSLSRARVRRFRDTGGLAGRYIAELLRLPRRLLITLLLGNLLVNTALSSILTDMFTKQLGPKAVGITVVVATALLLFFGEITPKTLAILRPVGLARMVALPMWCAVVLLTPIRVLIRLTTNFLLLLLRQGHVESEPILTREEFRATIRSGKAEGGLNADEAELIHAIAAFRTMVAREIMVPRPEMPCVPDRSTLAEAVQVARAGLLARLPVYHDSSDRITGVMVVAEVAAWLDLVTFEMTLEDVKRKCGRAFIAEPFLAPELCHVDALLADMDKRNERLAILVDEHGGTAGMISRDNILDSLLGGMIGCSSRRATIRIQPDGSILASGGARIEQINWECSLNLPEDLDDTIAGYVMRRLGALPKPGQSVADDRYVFAILQMTGNRVDFIRITPRGL